MADPKTITCPQCGSPYDVSSYSEAVTFRCTKCKAPVAFDPGASEAMESAFVIVDDDEPAASPPAPALGGEATLAGADGGDLTVGGADAEAVRSTTGAKGGGAAPGAIPATLMESDAGPPGTVMEHAPAPGGAKEAKKAPPARGAAAESRAGTGSRFTAMEEFERSRKGDPGGTQKRFGDFRVIKELGRGAMGVVYEAIQEPLGRRVALKVMLPSFTSSPEAVERFLRESKSTAKLKHPNIVPVYGMGESEGTYYYAMGFIEGDSLKDALKDDVMPFKERAAILRDSCRALHYAHDQGIIHRDIKPANIMIDKDKKVLIADFGIAKSEEQSTLTASGQVLGTPMYMSPEQAEGGSADVDRRSDIYSLGATLYETISLARPYHGEDVRSILRNVIETEPVPPRKIDPKIPKDLETICLKAMEKSPAKRYETAGDMADDLDHFIQGEPIKAKPLGLAAKVARKARKNKMATALILLLVLLVSGGSAFGGWWWIDRQARIRDGLADASATFEKGKEDPDKFLEAKDAYAKVLAIDAANAAAKEGIEKCDLMIKELSRLKNEAKVKKALAEGAAALEAGKFSEARKAYERALALDEQNEGARLGVANSIEAQKKARAEEESRRRLEKVRSLAGEGAALLEKGRAAQEAAAALDPGRERNDALDAAGRTLGAAAETFSEALKLDPGFAEARKGRAATSIARAAGALAVEDYPSALGFLLAAKEAGAEEFFAEEWATLHRQAVGTGTLTLTTDPDGASVSLETVVENPADRTAPRTLGAAPLERIDVPMGNYLLLVEKEGFAPVRLPIVVDRNEDVEAALRLLEPGAVPEGMVYVPGGGFRRGDPYSGFEKVEVPGFLMDRLEVSHEDYHAFILSIEDRGEQMNRLPRKVQDGKILVWWKPETFERFQQSMGRKLPIWGISREDAQAFARWKGKRLPTAVEWERAARGADGRLWPWGNVFADDRCNFFGRRPNISIEPVDGYEQWASPFGCLNMAGNVAEWTATDGPQVQDPISGRPVQQGVVCGGAAAESKYEVMTNVKKFYKVILVDQGIGLRCAQDLPGN